MFFILKVILIVFLNKTHAYMTQDSEIILLPAWNPTGAKEISLTLKAFGKQIRLNLRRNDQIVSSTKIWKRNAKGITEELNTSDPCYYLHDDHVNIAAINFCQEHGLEGVVFLESTTLDITPLQNNMASSSLIGDSCCETETNVSFGKPHLIKRSPRNADESRFYHPILSSSPLTIELAVFLDEAAYHYLSPIVNGNDTKIRDILLAYINGLQAVFHHPSLGVYIHILLTHMTIMQAQPEDLPRYERNADIQLKSFCRYANTYLDLHSPKYHWDIALYLTGIDLYESRTRHNDSTIKGFCASNTVCNLQSSCALVEFGVTLGDSMCQPSAGFASIYSAAHEIGCLLGMHNDNSKDEQWNPKDDYIMSLKRWQNTFYIPIWSMRSREVATELWRTKHCLLDQPRYLCQCVFMNSSGSIADNNVYVYYDYSIQRDWTAKRQCELYLHNRYANAVTLFNVCQYLQCEEPNRTNYVLSANYSSYKYKFNYSYFFAGPALEGTYCAPDSKCQNGICVRVYSDKPLISDHSEKGHWSEWKEESCRSHCLEKSKGVIAQRRICRDKNYRPANCEGESYDVKLCDDSTFCSKIGKPRLPIDKFIDMNCAKYKFHYLYLNLTGKGMQDAHNFDKPWLACTIYCLQEQKDYVVNYYAPRTEVTTMGLDPYLPDGTWCHTEKDRKYYCLKRRCLPEN